MPPAWFPSIGYLALLTAAESVFIEIHDTYPKQTCRNRCTILSAQGILNLSIPVNKPYGSKSKTNDILTFEPNEWSKKHWRAIESSYRKSPYFCHYSELIRSVIFSPQRDLVQLNLHCLEVMLNFLGINKEVRLSSEYMKACPGCIDARHFEQYITATTHLDYDRYTQVFTDRLPFHHNLSIIDLLCNLGPESSGYIQKVACVIQDKLF